jgi:hypothetical protein
MEFEKAHAKAVKEIMNTTAIMQENRKVLKQNESSILFHADEYIG